MSPVLILGFKRAERVSELLRLLVSNGFEKVFVSLDGPRDGNESDAKGVVDVLSVLESYAGKIELVVRRSSVNVGAGEAVFSGITWFLNQVESGIVLEDDCIPSKDFFGYCEKCLIEFNDRKDIGFVSGCRFFEKEAPDRVSLSNIAVTWGWAVWADRWGGFSRDLSVYSYIYRARVIRRQGLGFKCALFYFLALVLVEQEKLDAWDLQWAFYNWVKGRRSVVPPVNLMSYKGLDSAATHTSNEQQLRAVVAEGLLLEVDFSKVDESCGGDLECAEFIHSCHSWPKLIRMSLSVFIPKSIFKLIRRRFR